MSSQKGEEECITFTGKNAEEAEGFINAVNRRAWAAGKLDDYTWTAKFAYVCFTNKALRWYEELDEETQNDWRLLRRAILAKYDTRPHPPSIVPSSAPASASPPLSVVLAPAAAPPTPSIVRRGRIRVDRQGNSANAYIVGLPTTNDVACYTSASVSDACVFELDDRRRTITFQHDGSKFIVRAYREGWSLEPGTGKVSEVEYGALFQAPLDPLVELSTWSGTKWDDVWSVGPDGKVEAILKRPDGSTYILEGAMSTGTPIYLHSDRNAFMAGFASMIYDPVTLYFEPLS